MKSQIMIKIQVKSFMKTFAFEKFLQKQKKNSNAHYYKKLRN
ncbi:hypothetical protein KAOT1_12957 [Kordia algicida OT-1]|uniref:Uncharacterized protein n=1 Tax=Kordia algicida OT-1 TaxID=391587 RepID=A9DJL1_9FLAO|nr:hypothetical protein KAOT1_12957 [Kordia algicida OT-1]